MQLKTGLPMDMQLDLPIDMQLLTGLSMDMQL